jgi:hypothetical protein
MHGQSITLHVPDALYDRLKQRAEQADRSVEDEVLEVVATAIPPDDALPSYLARALAPLTLLDDEALWRAARSHLPPEAAARLAALHAKRQAEGLSDAETRTLARLMRQYERAMVVRAQAAMLLKQRGYDVSELVARA